MNWSRWWGRDYLWYKVDIRPMSAGDDQIWSFRWEIMCHWRFHQKKVIRLRKRGMLGPQYIFPYKSFSQAGKANCHLELTDELRLIHNTFFMSRIWNCLMNKATVVPLGGYSNWRATQLCRKVDFHSWKEDKDFAKKNNWVGKGVLAASGGFRVDLRARREMQAQCLEMFPCDDFEDKVWFKWGEL